MIGSIVMHINSASISVGVPLGLSVANDVEAPSPTVLEVGPSMASPTMVRFEDFEDPIPHEEEGKSIPICMNEPVAVDSDHELLPRLV